MPAAWRPPWNATTSPAWWRLCWTSCPPDKRCPLAATTLRCSFRNTRLRLPPPRRLSLERLQAAHARVVAATSADCVLRMLADWPQPPRQTLIAKGQGGRDDVQRHLRQVGGAVVEWDAYRRVAAAPAVAPDAVSAIVCSSGEGVRAAATVWFAGRGRPDVPVFVPSPRVKAVASEVGFRAMHVTAGAAPKAVVAAMNALKEQHV